MLNTQHAALAAKNSAGCPAGLRVQAREVPEPCPCGKPSLWKPCGTCFSPELVAEPPQCGGQGVDASGAHSTTLSSGRQVPPWPGLHVQEGSGKWVPWVTQCVAYTDGGLQRAACKGWPTLMAACKGHGCWTSEAPDF